MLTQSVDFNWIVAICTHSHVHVYSQVHVHGPVYVCQFPVASVVPIYTASSNPPNCSTLGTTTTTFRVRTGISVVLVVRFANFSSFSKIFIHSIFFFCFFVFLSFSFCFCFAFTLLFFYFFSILEVNPSSSPADTL